MTTLNLPSGEYLLVDVPEDAHDFEIEDNFLFFKGGWLAFPTIGQARRLPPGHYTLIGKGSEITEEVAKEVLPLLEHHDGFYGYKDFTGLLILKRIV